MNDNNLFLSSLNSEQLSELLRNVIRDELSRKYDVEQANKMLSPEEASHLFSPRVSIQTLSNYERKGLVIKYRMGRRTYYKYGEIMKAVQKVKRFSHNQIATQ
jgi:DNA-binding transcriptional ArsR family regulator